MPEVRRRDPCRTGDRSLRAERGCQGHSLDRFRGSVQYRRCAGARRLRAPRRMVPSEPARAGGETPGHRQPQVAELFRGRYLEVPEAAGRPLGNGRFYHHQVVGLPVQTGSGQHLGTIAEVLERPANDVWVSREGAVEHLIPATRDAVLEVDLEARRVVVADWLVETEDA